MMLMKDLKCLKCSNNHLQDLSDSIDKAMDLLAYYEFEICNLSVVKLLFFLFLNPHPLQSLKILKIVIFQVFEMQYFYFFKYISMSDFTGGPVVKNLPSNARDVALIP